MPSPTRRCARNACIPCPTSSICAELLGGRAVARLAGDVVVTGVTLDSRAVRPGDLYAALPGRPHPRRALRRRRRPAPAPSPCSPTRRRRRSRRRRRAAGAGRPRPPRRCSAASRPACYGEPADEAAACSGVTGTNGKTTTAYLLEAALRAAGRRTGLVGTVETRVGDETLAERAHDARGDRPAGAARA